MASQPALAVGRTEDLRKYCPPSIGGHQGPISHGDEIARSSVGRRSSSTKHAGTQHVSGRRQTDGVNHRQLRFLVPARRLACCQSTNLQAKVPQVGRGCGSVGSGAGFRRGRLSLKNVELGWTKPDPGAGGQCNPSESGSTAIIPPLFT